MDLNYQMEHCLENLLERPQLSINDQVKYILQNELGHLILNKDEDIHCLCHKTNDFYKKRSEYKHVEKLKEWYKNCSLNKYSKINEGNKYGYIKMLLYKETKPVKFITNNFFLRGKSKYEELYIVETDSYPSHCKTIFDMEKKNEKNKEKGILDINVQSHRVTTEHEQKWNFEKLSEDLKTNGTQTGKKRTIYCFVIAENNIIKYMSDFFSLISFKQLCKRGNKSMLEIHYNNLINNKENDFYYYVDTFFKGYTLGRKYQKYEQDFLFALNFYNVYKNIESIGIKKRKDDFKKEVLKYLAELKEQAKIKSSKIENEETCTNCSNSPTLCNVYDLENSPSLSEYSEDTLFNVSDLENSPSLSEYSEDTLFEEEINNNDNSQFPLICNNNDIALVSENINMASNVDNGKEFLIENNQMEIIGSIYYNGNYLIGILKADNENIYLYNRNMDLIGIYDRRQTIYTIQSNIVNVTQNTESECLLSEGTQYIGDLLISEYELKINIVHIYNSLATILLTKEEFMILLPNNELNGLQDIELQSEQQFQSPSTIEEQPLQYQPEISNPSEVQQSVMTLSNLNNIQLSNYISIY